MKTACLIVAWRPNKKTLNIDFKKYYYKKNILIWLKWCLRFWPLYLFKLKGWFGTDLKALEKLKEMLDKEDTGETSTVIVYGSFSEDLKSFCQKQGWILDYGVTKVYGFECEVKCNIKVLII